MGAGAIAALAVAALAPAAPAPAEFTARIDHRYWPMRPLTQWVYREREGGATNRVEVTVTRRTKRVASGVTARVVHDLVTRRGAKVEDTYDYYAQDRRGNLWYLGEDTKEYEHGRVTSTEGSWEAGVEGATAGIVLPAHPRVGMSYRQEYFRGHAEDRARVLGVDEQAQAPLGHWSHVLMTKDFTRLEPKVVELKFYAPGVGPVLTVAVSGGAGREELVRLRR